MYIVHEISQSDLLVFYSFLLSLRRGRGGTSQKRERRNE